MEKYIDIVSRSFCLVSDRKAESIYRNDKLDAQTEIIFKNTHINFCTDNNYYKEIFVNFTLEELREVLYLLCDVALKFNSSDTSRQIKSKIKILEKDLFTRLIDENNELKNKYINLEEELKSLKNIVENINGW